MTEYEKKILKRFDILLKILSVNMKFKLDNSSYKSKTTEEIKATANRENEILNSLHEGIQWSIKYFYMVALVL